MHKKLFNRLSGYFTQLRVLSFAFNQIYPDRSPETLY